VVFTYDADHRITSWSDRNGTDYHYAYDNGRVVGTAGSEGFLSSVLAYDPDERATTVTNSLGHQAVYRYDERHHVTRVTDPAGHSVVSCWDRYGRLLSQTDALGRILRFGYDETGNRTWALQSDGARCGEGCGGGCGGRAAAGLSRLWAPVLVWVCSGLPVGEVPGWHGNCHSGLSGMRWRAGRNQQAGCLAVRKRIRGGTPTAITPPLTAQPRSTRSPFCRTRLVRSSASTTTDREVLMGRASNHKKARRRVARASRAAVPAFQAEGRKQVRLLAGMLAATRIHREREERYVRICRAWRGDSEPVPARTPWWVHGSSGQQFAKNPFLGEARNAPCLATAVVPPAVVIADDPTQWHVAANVLIRSIVFDDLAVSHPAVTALLGALAPVAETELRLWPAVLAWLVSGERQHSQPAPAFPLLDGPVTGLGVHILADAARAVAGSNPGSEELAVLSRALEGAIPGVAGSVVTDALINSFNPLAALAASDAVQPGEVLGAGLATLQALVRLIQTDAALTQRRAA
jgi:YD repeat-containing protein